MANVYILNLKDNRENHDKNDDTKFTTCMRNGIISIGWGSEESRESSAYKTAINKFNEMKKGDLVWTKNPKTKSKFYLLEVVDDEGYDYFENEKEYYIHEDKSFARRIRKIESFSAENLPNGLTKKDIVARRTAERVHREFLINATLKIAKKEKENKK
ncbi:MAG: hypothetical protein K2I73_02385 [Eubacterium sp.]|nr:hypothetical protein [Eubacterium sp.]